MHRFIPPGRPVASRLTLHDRALRLPLLLPLIGFLLLLLNHISVLMGHAWLIPHFLELP